MSPKLPQVSGDRLVKLLKKMGYDVVRQRGSHIRLHKIISPIEHFITVPNHSVIDKGTLHRILSDVSAKCNIPKEDLLEDL